MKRKRADKNWLERRVRAITIIQKFVRKNILSKVEANKERMNKNFEYFNQMRLKLYTDVQILIAYHYRRHLKKKKLKKQKAQQKKEEQARRGIPGQHRNSVR